MMILKPYTPRYTPHWPLWVLNIGIYGMGACLAGFLIALLFARGAPSVYVGIGGIVFLVDIAVMLIVVASALMLENMHRHKHGLTPVALRGGRHWEHGTYWPNQIINCACFALGIYAAWLAFSLATAPV